MKTDSVYRPRHTLQSDIITFAVVFMCVYVGVCVCVLFTNTFIFIGITGSLV